LRFNDRFCNLYICASAVILITTILASINYLATPHVFRQMDTLGVSFRYYQRMVHEGFSLTWLLPAVLNSADTYGIAPMEFPFLNIINSLWFSVPFENKLPFVIAGYSILTFLLYLLCIKSWRNVEIVGIRMPTVIMLLPLASISQVYWGKFIPDLWALLLVMYGIGRSWNSKSVDIRSILLCTLALLIKPVVAVAFGILLIKDIKIVIQKYLNLYLWPVVIAGIYYFYLVKVLSSISDLHLFSISTQGLNSTISFYKNIHLFAKVWNRLLLFKFASILITFGIFSKIIKSKDSNIVRLLAILLLQVITISLLGGVAVYKHEYYFLSMSPLAILLSLYVIKEFNRYMKVLIYICGFVLNIEGMANNLKSLNIKKKDSYKLRNECIKMRRELNHLPWNSNQHFRTSEEYYPLLGLCLNERTNSTEAKYGVYYNKEEAPLGCKVLRQYEVLSVYECD